jgi:hypothetical protein
MEENKIEDESVQSLDIDNAIDKKAKTRDTSVSTLVNLLGVPTKDELKILDKKIDLILNKLDSLIAKVGTLSSELSTGSLNSALERIDELLISIKAKVEQ